MRTCAHIFLLAACLFPAMLFGQMDTVVVDDYFVGGEGTLNTAISEKISAGTLSNTVFKLQPFGYYVLNATIVVPAGEKLTIVADDPGKTQLTAPPMICWTPADVDKTDNFNCFGDVYLKNIWILYATTNQDGLGTQVGTCFEVSNDSTDNLNNADFDNVVFDYANIGSGGGAVTVSATHARLGFTNCYFRNLTDTHYRYYGRPISYRYNTAGYHIDKASFENCTFANVGYVYMQEGGEYTDTLTFNHCTFLNSVMFTLESGWWYWLSLTNSIFVNAYMFGDMGAADTSTPAGGALNIDSVGTTNFSFAVPFTDAQRHILFTNNSYYIDQWLRDYYQPGHNAYSDTARPENIPRPMPMMSEKTKTFFNDKGAFPYMSMADVYDFEEVGETANPGFLIPPTNVDGIKGFLVRKWTDNSDTTWAFDPHQDVIQSWPMNELLRYSNSTLKTAAMGGFPLGDLYRWWGAIPSTYTNWKAQKATEDAQIWDMLTDGIVAVEPQPNVPHAFELSQNYPNPFNPTTQIDYSLPHRSHVTLKVFNLLGMEVATLFSGVQDAGAYSATFDASRLSSGVYFYQLKAENVSITKKLLLMK